MNFEWKLCLLFVIFYCSESLSHSLSHSLTNSLLPSLFPPRTSSSLCSRTPVFKHPNVKWHGSLSSKEWKALLKESKFLIGLGDPLLGPSAIEAISAGSISMYIHAYISYKCVYIVNMHAYFHVLLHVHDCRLNPLAQSNPLGLSNTYPI